MRFQTGRDLSLLMLVALLQAGCNTTDEMQSVTLKEALTSSVDAMYEANAESQRQMKARGWKSGLGIKICQFNAKFMIDVKHSTADHLALSAGPPPAVVFPIPITLGISHDTTDAAERSNTVSVLYTSKECVMKATGAPDKDKSGGSGDK